MGQASSSANLKKLTRCSHFHDLIRNFPSSYYYCHHLRSAVAVSRSLGKTLSLLISVFTSPSDYTNVERHCQRLSSMISHSTGPVHYYCTRKPKPFFVGGLQNIHHSNASAITPLVRMMSSRLIPRPASCSPLRAAPLNCS